jgi:hypothetical protein
VVAVSLSHILEENGKLGYYLSGLTDLQRPKLSCGRMIRLHARPLLPSVSWTGHTQED